MLEGHVAKSERKRKTGRKIGGLKKEEHGTESGVAKNTSRAYERKSKDLNKAQCDIVVRLAKALKCDVTELMD